MFDLVAQGVVTVLFIVFVLVITFAIWVLWTIRVSISKLLRAVSDEYTKYKKDHYTKEELYHNVAWNELRGNHKAAAFWRELLERKYPDA